MTITAARRVTPAAVQVLPADAPEPDWLAARRWHLCSSDLPAVLGVDTRRTSLHVWYDKRGQLPDSDVGEEALWGKILESPVAAEWCRRNRSVVRRVGLIASIEHPWTACTLDRRVVECPLREGPCALEVKCRTAFLQNRWRRGVPDDVLAQVLWQIMVTGYTHLHVACLIGGNDYRQFVVRRTDHTDLLADVLAAASGFWHGNVATGIQPVPVGAAVGEPLTDLYDRLHPARDGTVELATRDHLATVMDALDARERGRIVMKDGKRLYETAKATLVGLLGDADTALLDGRMAYEYTSYDKEGVDIDRLREQFTDAWEACRKVSVVRTLRIASEHRQNGGNDE